jgi:hypothetical protein
MKPGPSVLENQYTHLVDSVIETKATVPQHAFILFINMFLNAIETIAKKYKWKFSPNMAFLLAYCDEIAFYAANREDLKLMVDEFDKFLTFYGFQIGHDKSAYQHINAPNNNAKAAPLLIQGIEIPHLTPAQTYKYLGYEASNGKYTTTRY